MVLTFVITARDAGGVLARVVMLFHRSAVEIESIHMPVRRRKGNDLKIAITVDGRCSNARRMAAILEKAVDVLSVETVLPRDGPSKAMTPRARLAQNSVAPGLTR